MFENDHDDSKCPREIYRLKKAAQKQGEQLPGADKSTKRDSHSQEVGADANEGWFMCFALRKASWAGHPVAECFSKEKFNKRLKDPEQRIKLA